MVTISTDSYTADCYPGRIWATSTVTGSVVGWATSSTTMTDTVSMYSSTISSITTAWLNYQYNECYRSTSQCRPIESEAERQTREARERAISEQTEKEAAERRKAAATREIKARQLLAEVLTEEQNRQLNKEGYFDLVSVKSGRRYRVRKGCIGNVTEINATNRRLKTLCFHPAVQVHDYDTMAIQKLMLENEEEQVLKVANFS